MLRSLDVLLQDAKFAFRMYRRAPGFTLTALLAMALGIGATSAVFSVTDRILFRPLPYRADKELISFGMVAKVVDDGEFLFASDYKDLSVTNTPLRSFASWSGVNECDITDRNPIRQHCAEIEWNFLHVLGVRPLLGEDLSKNDVQPGAPAKAILSYGAWQSHFGRDPNVVGKTLLLDSAPFRIVGVLPVSFELPTLEHADVLTPQIISPAGWAHGATRVLRVIGRLKHNITLNTAPAQLQPFFHGALSQVPAQFQKEVQFRVRRIRDRQMGAAQPAAWALLGAALAVMLISCANVANLLLARTASRRSELAIRRALGVSRARLLRQMLTEGLLLALCGAAGGCLLGALLLRIAVALDPNGIPHLADVSLDARALLICLALSVVAGLLCGLLPAFESPRAELLGSSRTVAPRSSTRLKNTLVAAQIALSTVLLAGAGLLVQSLWNLETQSLGMQPEHVLTAQLVLPSSRYTKPEERIAFFNQIERKLGSLPGIRAFGISDSLPPGGWQRSRPLYSLQVVGSPSHGAGTGGLVDWRYVSPGYFEVLRIPVLQGRSFTEQDRTARVNLCLLSRSLSRRLFPTRNPVGQHLRIGETTTVEIAGIVPDVKNTGLEASDNPEYYILRTHVPDETYINGTGPVAQRTLSMVLRSAIPDATLAGLVKRNVAELDGTLPVTIQSMSARLREMTAAPRFDAWLLFTFALTGLFLASVGLYGTIAYLVTQRTQEIGIRMSLGATHGQMAALVLLHSAKWTSVGAAIGIAASLAATRVLSSLLFRVTARDPVLLLAAVVCLLVVALVASAQPAIRAARTDPATALRING